MLGRTRQGLERCRRAPAVAFKPVFDDELFFLSILQSTSLSFLSEKVEATGNRKELQALHLFHLISLRSNLLVNFQPLVR